MTAALGRKYDRRLRVRSCGRGGRRPSREIVIDMNEMIETVLATVGWAAGVSVLLVMALLPLLERFGSAR